MEFGVVVAYSPLLAPSGQIASGVLPNSMEPMVLGLQHTLTYANISISIELRVTSFRQFSLADWVDDKS